MSLLLVVALGLLAHARLTRLITTDRVTQPLRATLVRRFGPASALAYLIHCRWCTGIWLAAPVAAATAALAGVIPGWGAWRAVLFTALLALAYSHTTGLLVRAEGEE